MTAKSHARWEGASQYWPRAVLLVCDHDGRDGALQRWLRLGERHHHLSHQRHVAARIGKQQIVQRTDTGGGCLATRRRPHGTRAWTRGSEGSSAMR
eukprot:4861227-Pleurochrysis_carterae.AAC.1